MNNRSDIGLYITVTLTLLLLLAVIWQSQQMIASHAKELDRRQELLTNIEVRLSAVEIHKAMHADGK